MVKGMKKALTYMSRCGAVPALALAILIFLSSTGWSQPYGRPKTGDMSRGRVLLEDMIAQPWQDPGNEAEEWVQIQRKDLQRLARRLKGGLETKWGNYESLSAEEKARIRRKAEQWRSLPPERRELLRLRMQRLRKLPPEDRALFHHRFNQWQGLSPEERERIRKKLEIWDSLPPKEQEEIRRKFLTP